MRDVWELERPAGIVRLLVAVAVLGSAQGCKRQGIVAADEEAETAAGAAPANTDDPPPDLVDSPGHFLDPLLGAPWLGHADDGSLVRVEFFVSDDAASALCRTSIVHAFGGAPTSKSLFTATADLAQITWDEGSSRASYDAATQTVVASIASNARIHQVALRQVNTDSNPELTTFRTSIPTDEQTQAQFQNFSAALETGKRWWKSIDDWGKLVTPQDPITGGTRLALIRPADKFPPIIPSIEPGGHFNLPIECLLPPGSALAEADSTIGIVAELHHSGDVQATWIIHRLNPGAVSQILDAHWMVRPGEAVPSGDATIYVYLAQTKAPQPGGSNRSTDLAIPVSNLLRIEIKISPPAKP